MPLAVVGAIVVYCTTFIAACILFSIWKLQFIGEKAAIIALVPAIIAYAWLM